MILEYNTRKISSATRGLSVSLAPAPLGPGHFWRPDCVCAVWLCASGRLPKKCNYNKLSLAGLSANGGKYTASHQHIGLSSLGWLRCSEQGRSRQRSFRRGSSFSLDSNAWTPMDRGALEAPWPARWWFVCALWPVQWVYWSPAPVLCVHERGLGHLSTTPWAGDSVPKRGRRAGAVVWQQSRHRIPSAFRRGFDSLVLLISWMVWNWLFYVD
jgi:hypothetical protein